MTDVEKDPLKFVFAVIAIHLMGGFASALPPLLVGGNMAGLSLSESAAGNIVFAELSALALTVLVISPILPRLTYRSLCFPAALIAIVANALTLVPETAGGVMFIRVVAGVSEGVIYAVSLAAVASTSRNPDRLYGLFAVSWAVMGFVMFGIGGFLSTMYAHRGLYAMIGVSTLLLLPFLRGLPAKKAAVPQQSKYKISIYVVVLVNLSMFFYMAGSSALYSYTEPLGVRLGLSASEIGLALSMATIIGLSGAIIATWLNIRFGRILPITTVIVLFTINALMLCNTESVPVYFVGLALTAMYYFFSLPYFYGVAAALDKEGRLAAAVGFAFLVGSSAGPLGGHIVEWKGYPGLGWAIAASAVIGWILMMAVIRQLNRLV